MPLTRNRRRRSPVARLGFIPPQLATLVKQAPDGPGYLHEIKLDGYRMAARLDNGDVRLLTRTGLDWTTKYPTIAEALTELPARSAYLDGELCGVLPDGRTAFNLIQNAADTRSGPQRGARCDLRDHESARYLIFIGRPFHRIGHSRLSGCALPQS